ncbi:sulfatase family protein [Flammeovirga kamogawensis]|uniref:Sulfatase n=1 Tax=Flammeovirga kamogawensis TaxID=373891 RepID=A0ABX8H4Q5_9BACT|nr:sulfatase [Flammeovirga kamogawensis]MBB6463549.1 putative sulfatase [Flammeovirga kamogawensis]QWG10604.1 sulfatase [Flammeovirga kamogawensis]TRX63709.1 sulfatase [Flammeovirga kamogawensis]
MKFHFLLGCLLGILTFLQAQSKPNLIIIQTDEHNFRTLGCYRDQLPEEQAYVWGKGVEVETPNIDRIANEGAICMNYYGASPVCTPSRASFQTGLFPQNTGAWKNNLHMTPTLTTYAKVLQNNGYATSYVGKWHLDGNEKPGFAPSNKFGYSDNQYMFNGGHNPWFKVTEEGEHFPVNKNMYYKWKKEGRDMSNIHFTTDYLTDRSLEILERDKNIPFCLMLSIPDPHTPNIVEGKYKHLYDDMVFEKPITMVENTEQRPSWGAPKNKNEAKDEIDQEYMRGYFGMVKCIDDNVGRILKFLEENKLDQNTIIIFTSDHGDMLFEHKRRNKSVPYETAARVPFVIRYPKKIKAGKVINAAYVTTDFGPTILGIMNQKEIPNAEGYNAAATFLGKSKVVTDNRLTYYRTSGGGWIAGVTNRYKLVLSVKEKPWLFDLEKDPNEFFNVFNDPEYKEIATKMHSDLLKLMTEVKEPGLAKIQGDSK